MKPPLLRSTKKQQLKTCSGKDSPESVGPSNGSASLKSLIPAELLKAKLMLYGAQPCAFGRVMLNDVV